MSGIYSQGKKDNIFIKSTNEWLFDGIGCYDISESIKLISDYLNIFCSYWKYEHKLLYALFKVNYNIYIHISNAS